MLPVTATAQSGIIDITRKSKMADGGHFEFRRIVITFLLLYSTFIELAAEISQVTVTFAWHRNDVIQESKMAHGGHLEF